MEKRFIKAYIDHNRNEISFLYEDNSMANGTATIKMDLKPFKSGKTRFEDVRETFADFTEFSQREIKRLLELVSGNKQDKMDPISLMVKGVKKSDPTKD